MSVSIGSFLPAVGCNLAGGQAAVQYLGNLAPGASDVLYWYVTYPCSQNTVCSITATVSDGLPGVKTFTTNVTTKSTISANAGGLINAAGWGEGAVVGQVIFFDVTYSFGNANVGDEYNMQPSGNLDFDANTFQFVNAEVRASVIPKIRVGAKDSLFFVGGLKNGASNLVTMRYYFQVMHSNSLGTNCCPYAVQTSGNQIKYTGNYCGVMLSNNPTSVTFPFVLTLQASSNVADGCDTIDYRVVVRNTSNFASSYTEIKVFLPTDMRYIGLLPSSEVSQNMLMAFPSAGEMGYISWVGGVASAVFPYKEFYIPANDSLILTWVQFTFVRSFKPVFLRHF